MSWECVRLWERGAADCCVNVDGVIDVKRSGGNGRCWAGLVFLHALLQLNPGDIPRMGDARLDLRVMGFSSL